MRDRASRKREEYDEGREIRRRRDRMADMFRRGRSTQAEPEKETLIPDLHSRYFTADFPYGLSVIQQIGQIAGVSMPNIDELIEWYDGIAIVNDKLMLSDYGITDMETLRAFYLQ